MIPIIPYILHFENIKKVDSNEQAQEYTLNIDIDIPAFSYETYKRKSMVARVFDHIIYEVKGGTYTLHLGIVSKKIINIHCLDLALPRYVLLALLSHNLLEGLAKKGYLNYCGCKEKMKTGDKCYCFECGSRPCTCFFWKNSDEMYSELHGCKCEYPAILGELFYDEPKTRYKKCIWCQKPICSGKPLLLGVITYYNKQKKEGIISYRSGPFRDWTQNFKVEENDVGFAVGDYVTFRKSRWSDEHTDLLMKYDRNVCLCNEVTEIKNFTTCSKCNGYKIIFDKGLYRYIGKIKSYNEQKGFGFIDYHFGEIFFHKNELRDSNKPIKIGDEVIFSRAIENQNKNNKKTNKKNKRNATETKERTYAHKIVLK